MNRLATGLFVYGLSEATAAASLGTRASKIEVVHNATRSNADKWGDMASRRCYERLIKATEAARSNGQLVLTFIGRLTPEKKVASLLDAIEFLADRYPGIKVYIVGDGPSRPRLERHQQRRHCVFLGPVYDEEVLEAVLKETTLAISPDRIGLFAIDALRAGVPVLVPENSANGPEIEALALGVNALSFEAGNPRSIAECVDRWFELVPSITESQYVQARNEELRKWDSSNVADSILLGCMLDTDN